MAAHNSEQGMRPGQIWLPDIRSAEFAEAAHEQSAAIAAAEHDADGQAFVDAITWDWAASGDDAAHPEHR
jgi:hypothetical protein